MKVNEIHISDLVVTTDSPSATVYEVISLFRKGTNVVAGLREVGIELGAYMIDIATLQRPTAEQLTQKEQA